MTDLAFKWLIAWAIALFLLFVAVNYVWEKSQ